MGIRSFHVSTVDNTIFWIQVWKVFNILKMIFIVETGLTASILQTRNHELETVSLILVEFAIDFDSRLVRISMTNISGLLVAIKISPEVAAAHERRIDVTRLRVVVAAYVTVGVIHTDEFGNSSVLEAKALHTAKQCKVRVAHETL